MRSALLGLAIGAALSGCIVRDLVAGPRLTGTCAGACEHYVGCKPDHPSEARARCVSECPETMTDPETLMMFESLSCRDTLAFVDGPKPATARK